MDEFEDETGIFDDDDAIDCAILENEGKREGGSNSGCLVTFLLLAMSLFLSMWFIS